MTSLIAYGHHEISLSDVEAVVHVLQSNFLTQGQVVPNFEAKLRSITEAKYATAVNSATSALHVACISLGVQEGDWVWTVPNTFVASGKNSFKPSTTINFQKSSSLSI